MMSISNTGKASAFPERRDRPGVASAREAPNEGPTSLAAGIRLDALAPQGDFLVVAREGQRP